LKQNKFICIHGHFYQPPRENAWLEVIEIQDSAHPYHDWNERINAECYAPNTTSRILDSERKVISKISNNYSYMSFNFGPSLLSWMETNNPTTYQSILDADKDSIARFDGHGSAMAQVYNHIIMPLANQRDKETQIIWGIVDFESRFKRKPEGMWLAETAVDTDTLELLANHEIKFTVLAPRQAKAIRKIGDNDWTSVNDTSLDTSRSYLCKLPSGKTITLFFYNGRISQEVAFNGLLNDGKVFADSLISNFNKNNLGPQLIHIATDGETYGHHHKNGDMALAYCIEEIENHKDVSLINYGAYLEKFPATYEAQIVENSSWSCVHGVERWRSNCGCNTGTGFTQSWREPLRNALDWLRDTLSEIFEKTIKKHCSKPWEMRNDYIKVILNRDEKTINNFIKSHCKSKVNINKTLRLMEMQRHALLMYTSCAWFFDEISGIETTQVLQYACRAIQLSKQLTDTDLENEFLKLLENAPSNMAKYANGVGVYRKLVMPTMLSLKNVGMHYAVSSIFDEDPESLPLFTYKATNEFLVKKVAGEQRLALGITQIRSNITRSEQRFLFATVYMGNHELIGSISLDMEFDKFASMQFRMIAAFEEGRLSDVISLLYTYFGPEKYSIWSLFKEEQRKTLNIISKKAMDEIENSFRNTYNKNYMFIKALAKNNISIPKAYMTTIEYILNTDLIKCFQKDKIKYKNLVRIVEDIVLWKINVEDPIHVEHIIGESIFKEIKYVRTEMNDLNRIQNLNKIFGILEKINISPNLYLSQNLYFKISNEVIEDQKQKISPLWLNQFYLLGENIGLKIHK